MMENNGRFRNHISIVAERMGSIFFFLFIALMSGLAQNISALADKDMELGAGAVEMLLVLAGILAVFVILVIWQVVVWSKTYISIQDNTIVLERNTLNRKKNTIGIKNISNVNTEQNLFEMILGTCKVKLDTNSLSTADKTDVKIVLKKAEAEQFRQTVMQLLRQSETGRRGISKGEGALNEMPFETEEHMQYDIAADMGDMLVHGLFSINFFSVLVLVGCIVGAVEMIAQTVGAGLAGRSIFGILASLLVMVFFFFSALWDIVKGFIQYYDFKVKRLGNKIYIRYGLFKKVRYTIPVDKINAVKLTQSLQARIAGRYMAEIINVGMGDDENEKQAFFVLYCKQGQMEENIQVLLPEFAGVFTASVKRQPAKVWAVWMLPFAGYALIAGTSLGIALEFLPEFWFPVLMGILGITALAALFAVCGYLTAGSLAAEEFLILANGYLRRYMVCIKYDKIQHIRVSQNFLARRARIQKGSAYLLASAIHMEQTIPYFKEEELTIVRKRMLGTG